MNGYGFHTTNKYGEILISDEMETYHFLNKITPVSNDGGNYDNFPTYSGVHDYDLDGRIIFTYTLYTSSIPLVFIKPTNYSRFHSLLSMTKNSTYWTIKVIVSGMSVADAPTLYTFVKASEAPVNGEEYGISVYNETGGKTFDSRLKPMIISDGGSCQSPSTPCNSGIPGTTNGHPWNYATLDWDFGSSSRYNSYPISYSIPYTSMMFLANAQGQAAYKRQMHGYKKSCGCCGCCCQQHWSTAMWWAMYRQGFRIQDSVFQSGWNVHAAAYSFSSVYEDGGWFGGGGGSFSEGTMPFNASTINSTGTPYMIADSRIYNV